MQDGANHLGGDVDHRRRSRPRVLPGRPGRGAIHELIPAAEVVHRFVDEAEAALARRVDRSPSLARPWRRTPSPHPSTGQPSARRRRPSAASGWSSSPPTQARRSSPQVTSLKIGRVFGQSVDMGTFVYPITFTLRDVVHKVLGRHLARTLIISTAGVNLFLAGYLLFTDHVQSDPSWGLGEEWHHLLGPVWRICRVDHRDDRERADRHRGVPLVRHPGDDGPPVGAGAREQRGQPAGRATSCSRSGAFGALPFLAHTNGTLPWSTVWSIFWVNMWVKGLVSVCSMPLIYVTPHSSHEQ